MKAREICRNHLVIGLILIALQSLPFRELLGSDKTTVNSVGPDRIHSAIDSSRLALPGVVVVKFKSGPSRTMKELYNVPALERQIVSEGNPVQMNSLPELLNIKQDKASEILRNIYFIRYSGTVTPAKMAQSLLQNSDVLYAEPHYMYSADAADSIPGDSLISQQYALNLVHAFQAWNITMGDPNVVVAIVDCGVNWMHPDLYPNIWHNPHWMTDTRYPADSIGWDFGGLIGGHPDNDPEEDFPPPYEHGTHVAGIIAAAGIDSGTVGVAPGCKIMAVKASEADIVDPRGVPYTVYGYEGIIYAADNGARVINCSWGGVNYSQYGQDVIDYATSEGALVVAAAGNDHSQEFYQPAYCENVLSVAAVDQNDVAATFSNYSYNISVSAPGVSILSTLGTSSYSNMGGTSMASPCAAGVAALVASKFPNYSPQQILEQVRVTSDNIDSINSEYKNMIGYGRVNAYRALTETSSPGVKISGITLSDSVGGNNDGMFTDGETVQIFGVAENWLSPTSNLHLSLSSTDRNVTVVNGNISIGALGTLDSYNLRNNALSFKINKGTPDGHVANFVIKISDGTYNDYTGFTAIFNPIFSNLSGNNIQTTISAAGNIGYNNNVLEGIGFIYGPDNDNVLSEGAFMAGTSPTTLVDCARGAPQNVNLEDSDFLPFTLVNVKTPGLVADQEAVTSFSDSNATSYRVGIQVTLHTYAWNRDSTSNFILLEYHIHNLNTTPDSNFFAGLFFDWDVGANGSNNVADFERAISLGYAYNQTRTPRTYVGCALLGGGAINYSVIDNADPITGIYKTFTKLRKWQCLSGGTVTTKAGPTDISMVVSGGPMTIQPNSDIILPFVLAAGDTLADLERAVTVAKEMYGTTTRVEKEPSTPKREELCQNFPNPFNPTTEIRFSISKLSTVKMKVFDILGREVATLVNEQRAAGNYSVKWNASNLPSGVYFCQLRAGSFVGTKKLLLMK